MEKKGSAGLQERGREKKEDGRGKERGRGKGKKKGKEREVEILEEGKEKRKGKCERKRKQKRKEKGKKQVRRPELPRAPTCPRAPVCGAAPGSGLQRTGLRDLLTWASPERPTPQPRVLPERRRMDGRPPRTGSRCAPVCRVHGRPEGA